eukprot:350211_1
MVMTQPTIVKILPKITIKSISDIDIVNQTFRAELDYEFKWQGTDADYDKYRYKLLFPKFKPVISILNTKESTVKFKMKRRDYDEEIIHYKCIKDTISTDINWIIHSFTIRAIFYNNFSSSIDNFPFDYHKLSMQISVNKTPTTWNDDDSGIRFEIDCSVYNESITDKNKINKIYLPFNWTLNNTVNNNNSNNSIINVKSSHKPVDERADLLLNGYVNDIDELEEDIPLDIIKLINNRLGENNEWMNEPLNQCNIINIQLTINRNYKTLLPIYRIFLTVLFITMFCIPSIIFPINFAQSFFQCIMIIVSIILIQILFVTHYKLQSLSYATIFDKYCYCCIAYVFMIVFVNYYVFTNTMQHSIQNCDNYCKLPGGNSIAIDNIYISIGYIIIFVIYHMFFLFYLRLKTSIK